MTHRERMLATIRGEPTDQIPWAPRMDLWSIAHRTRGTLSEAFVGLNTAEIADVLGVACHAVRADYTIPRDPQDLMLRGFGLDNHPDFPYRIEVNTLPVEFQDEGHTRTTTIQTSSGEVTTRVRTSPDMSQNGISRPFIEAYPIQGPDDLEAVAQVFEHLEVIPTPEAYAAFHDRIGERGLAVAHGCVGASPLHLILHDLAPIDQFFYLYVDNRDALYDLAARIEPLFDAMLEAVLACEAEVVLWGGNYDQSITSPPFFQREIAPWLQRISERLHRAGKYLLTHTDGENQKLLPLYPACDFDVAESVCPAPMTRTTLAEVRAGMGPETTVWGGIPSISLLKDSMDEPTFEAYLTEVFDALGSAKHLIFGVSDNVPPDADLARLERIRERIAMCGPVNP
ncbi:hypothetical protein GF339_18245 [candidate division KSB3 bacterium]|uniref:Uroporphyrinogen decarboxylase (URO-D) domain-containing protein n=1 Tax=candidate division KSB3 bacterium TaxID=2044937 RepID=A0A9D5JZA9_9BACT|nr:hypothetical protein [candidate division KSB3 bacterium]MBD3326531.1 hypothetical protein [candidate division KSB3 bacterium]